MPVLLTRRYAISLSISKENCQEHWYHLIYTATLCNKCELYIAWGTTVDKIYHSTTNKGFPHVKIDLAFPFPDFNDK